MDLETQKYLGERKNPITIYDELDYTWFDGKNDGFHKKSNGYYSLL